MKRRGRNRRRLLGFAVIGLVVARYRRQRRRQFDSLVQRLAEPVAVTEPVAVAVAPPEYNGRIRIEPSVATTGDWAISIDDPARAGWRGIELAPAAVTVVARLYTVTLLDGDRKGQAATATVTYRYGRGSRSGRPQSLQLNGKTSFA